MTELLPKRGSRPAWILNEVESAGRENLDVDHVGRYDSKEDSGAGAEVDLLVDIGLDHDSVVVEFGPGTGQFTLAIAPRCRQLVAVDVSRPMISLLQHKLTTGGVENVTVIEAGFLTYEHHGTPADFVYSRYALHHLPDFWKGVALSRIHDMLKPGGVFRLWDVVYGFEPSEAASRIEAWCATGTDTPPGHALDEGWGRWELEEHVRDEYSTYSWLLESMFERTGFTIDVAEFSENRMFAKYVLRCR
jgi:SAM-dependent methyltransferase